MRASMTGDSLYALFLMLRKNDVRVLFAVEGAADVSTLHGHIDRKTCLPIPGYSKPAVLKAMDLVRVNGMSRVIALVDADHASDADRSDETIGIFSTSMNDLDAEIFFTPTLADRVAYNYAQPARLDALLDGRGIENVADAVVELVGPIAALQVISQRNRYGFDLHKFPYNAVIGVQPGTEEYLRAVVRLVSKISKNDLPSEDVLLDDLQAELRRQAENGTLRIFCRGHDLLAALAAICRYRCQGTGSVAQIQKSVRSSMSCHDLATKDFYMEILRWSSERKDTVWSCAIPGVGVSPQKFQDSMMRQVGERSFNSEMVEGEMECS